MIRLHRPTPTEIAAVLDHADRPFSYAEIGATADPAAIAALAARYTVDRRRFPLGHGRARFERARAALFAWRCFEIPWLTLEGGDRPVQTDRVVATLTCAFGLWLLNPCRVVDRREEAGDSGETNEVSFAYGTLEGHAATGEERFSLRRDPRSEAISFEIVAFSRPALLLTRLGRPYMRRVQRRFAFDAARALARASEPPGAMTR